MLTCSGLVLTRLSSISRQMTAPTKAPTKTPAGPESKGWGGGGVRIKSHDFFKNWTVIITHHRLGEAECNHYSLTFPLTSLV